MLRKALEKLGWSFESGKAPKDSTANLAIREISETCRTAIEQLSNWLKDHSADDDEYDDEYDDDTEPDTDPDDPPKKPTSKKSKATPKNSKATSTPATPGSGRGNHEAAKGVLWSFCESLMLLRVLRDFPQDEPSGINAERAREFNRRTNAIVGRLGVRREDRIPNAVRLQIRGLRDANVTIASLEPGLDIKSDGKK